MIIVIDGPNKSGKTTLIEGVKSRLIADGKKVQVRHWGPLKTDDREYTESLIADYASDEIVIWDRSWVCEYVYGTMLGRDRRLVHSPWLGEFLHTRGVRQNGAGFIVMPALAGLNIGKLDKTDGEFSADPYKERELFNWYAQEFNWHTLFNNYEQECMDGMINLVISAIEHPQWINSKSNVAIITGEEEYIPGGWLAGSSEAGIKLAAKLSYGALMADWLPAKTLTAAKLSKYDMVVATHADHFKFVRKDKYLVDRTYYIPMSIGELEDAEDFDGGKEIMEALAIVIAKLERDWNAATHLLHVC